MPLFRIRILLCGLGLIGWTSHASAQPSGQAYGPIQQFYAPPTAERVVYVAPDGDSAARGNELDVPTTLAAAIAQARTGDVIVLRGGVYRTGSLRLSQGVTLQPHADERPVIKGTEIATEWRSESDGNWSVEWTRLFPNVPADWWRRSERNLARSPLHLFNDDMVFRNGGLLQAVGRREDVSAETYFIDYENARVFVGADPAGHEIEITAHHFAINRTMRSAHGKPNDGRGLTVRGITFTQFARLALLVEGVEPGAHLPPESFGKEVVGTTLEHVTISQCSRVAGYFRGDGLVMRHCLVSDCGTEGIYVINSADVLLERNVVTRTNSAENLAGYFATAIKIFNQSYRCVVRDNLIIDNPNASGVWYDVGNVDGIFVNNWIETTDNGFFFEISKGAICAGNVFVNCGTGVRVLNSSGVRVYQNTFYNSTAAFQRSARSHTAGDHFGWHASAGPDVDERDGHALVNNLMVADAGFSRPLAEFWQQDEGNARLTTPPVDTMNGNAYVRRGAGDESVRPLIAWSPIAAPDYRVDLATLADLTALQSNFETEGKAWTEYFGPLFRSEWLQRFELSTAFPGANTGAQLPEAVRDALGWAEGTPFPGAYAPTGGN